MRRRDDFLSAPRKFSGAIVSLMVASLLAPKTKIRGLLEWELWFVFRGDVMSAPQALHEQPKQSKSPRSRQRQPRAQCPTRQTTTQQAAGRVATIWKRRLLGRRCRPP